MNKLIYISVLILLIACNDNGQIEHNAEVNGTISEAVVPVYDSTYTKYAGIYESLRYSTLHNASNVGANTLCQYCIIDKNTINKYLNIEK